MGNSISEAQTRRDIIDKRLKKAGWDVSEPTPVTTELDIWVGLPEGVTEPQHEHQGHQYVDYVLLGENGYPLAVVEAKKTSRDARIGQEQARQYAVNIAKTQGRKMPQVLFCHSLPSTPKSASWCGWTRPTGSGASASRPSALYWTSI